MFAGVAFDWDEIINNDVDWLSSYEESDLESTNITVLILTWEDSLDSLWIGGKRRSLGKEPAVTFISLLGNFDINTVFTPKTEFLFTHFFLFGGITPRSGFHRNSDSGSLKMDTQLIFVNRTPSVDL